MYDAGRRFAGFDRSEVEDELVSLRQEIGTSRAELKRLQAIADAADSRMSIERAAQSKLAEQIRTLEQDNARLREDLAIFENVLTSDARNAQALTVQRFKVVPEPVPGEFRYQLVLLAGARKDRSPFQGRVELLITVQEGGRNAMIVLPDRGEAESPAFRLGFRHFQRLDGRFRVNPSARLVSVQARVFESGSPQAKATQSATIGP